MFEYTLRHTFNQARYACNDVIRHTSKTKGVLLSRKYSFTQHIHILSGSICIDGYYSSSILPFQYYIAGALGEALTWQYVLNVLITILPRSLCIVPTIEQHTEQPIGILHRDPHTH